MRKRWNPSEPIEMVPIELDAKHYQQLLAELSTVLYEDFCQLEEDPSFCLPAIGSETPEQQRRSG